MKHGGTTTRALLATICMAAALTVAGCSSSTAGSDGGASAAASETPAAAPAARFAAPAADDVADADAESEFLRTNRATLRGMESATDDELLSAGYAACEQFADGVELEEITTVGPSPDEIVEGFNDEALAGLASQLLCTEFDVTLG